MKEKNIEIWAKDIKKRIRHDTIALIKMLLPSNKEKEKTGSTKERIKL